MLPPVGCIQHKGNVSFASVYLDRVGDGPGGRGCAAFPDGHPGHSGHRNKRGARLDPDLWVLWDVSGRFVFGSYWRGHVRTDEKAAKTI